MLFIKFYLFLELFLIQYAGIEKLQADIETKTLQGKKFIATKGKVYYKNQGALLITHFTSPFEQVTITNGNGEFKHYNKVDNSVNKQSGPEYSSKLSIFYNIVNGKTSDLGLKASGYAIVKTELKENLVITTWNSTDKNNPFSKIEMAHERFIPIFIAFYTNEGKINNKVYYADYVKVDKVQFPSKITEFQYLANGDSLITKKSYSNFKINNSVEETFFNYKIPETAKLITQ